MRVHRVSICLFGRCASRGSRACCLRLEVNNFPAVVVDGMCDGWLFGLDKKKC